MKLFDKIDNSQLVLFRIFYGIIIFFECLGAVAIGWVQEIYNVPKDTFGFIGFEFLPHPPTDTYIAIYLIMAVLGALIALGYRYRLSALLLALFWTFTYLTHKVHYNNHHYLMFLLNWIMVFVPANHTMSLDAKKGRAPNREWCRQWHVWIFVGLLAVAYTYAAVAKMNPDWIRAVPLKEWLGSKANLPIIGALYKSEFTAYGMAWGGLVFDLLVVPLLLWKRTRFAVFLVSIVFHLSNSITFQIGTFPYTMIAACVLFFPPETIQKRFLKGKKFFKTVAATKKTKKQKVVQAALMGFMIIQVLLPLRHYTIPGNVFWTEEGHRLSWRMMLRAKAGQIRFEVYKDGKRVHNNPLQNLSTTQYRMVSVKPDFMWQYVQRLKKEYGPEAEIYIKSKVRLNDHPYNTFVDPNYNMAKAKWNYFGHADWIEPFNGWKERP
jgi:vitamin K-dependent gamma-carboxylase